MRSIIVSETIQEFGSVRYYRCGWYFQHRGKRLHRMVWEHHNGPIPDGAHIHHKDGDRSNNAIENLECLTPQEHLGGVHGKASGEFGRRWIDVARIAAAKWHGSAPGWLWHSDHYERHIRRVMEERMAATCHECGSQYLVTVVRAKQAKYCGGACRARALRKRRKRGEGDRLLPD